MSNLIDLGTISLAGYSGVSEPQAPKKMNVFGFRMPDTEECVWGPNVFPSQADVRHGADLAATYRVTLEIPNVMTGRLSEKWGDITEMAEAARVRHLAAK